MGKKNEVARGVRFAIAEVSLIVVICLFAHRDGEDKRQRGDIRDDVAYAPFRAERRSVRYVTMVSDLPIFSAGMNWLRATTRK